MATLSERERIIAMDKRGYSHKPLARVDITDDKVTKVLDLYGKFDHGGRVYVRDHNAPDQPTWQMSAALVPVRGHYLDPEQYACWMTDPKDLMQDSWRGVGTSCVVVEPSQQADKKFSIYRHVGENKWAQPFYFGDDTDSHHGSAVGKAIRPKSDFYGDTAYACDSLTTKQWVKVRELEYYTFVGACRDAEAFCKWESHNRKLLAEYRAQYPPTEVVTADDADPLPKRTVASKAEDASAKWSKDKKKARLIEVAGGIVCCGCGHKFDHPSYLEVDHIRPRADGGADSLYNLVLLCRPCNARKSARITLTGLREKNRKDGFMVQEIDIPQIGFIHE